MYCRQPPTTPPINALALLPLTNCRYKITDPEGMDNLVSWSTCVRTGLTQGHYMIKSKGSSENLTQVEGPKTPLDANEQTTPYIICRELNLRKLPGRQWESNPQTSEQLRPMTIKTSASTETATAAYIPYTSCTLVQ